MKKSWRTLGLDFSTFFVSLLQSNRFVYRNARKELLKHHFFHQRLDGFRFSFLLIACFLLKTGEW